MTFTIAEQVDDCDDTFTLQTGGVGELRELRGQSHRDKAGESGAGDLMHKHVGRSKGDIGQTVKLMSCFDSTYRALL